MVVSASVKPAKKVTQPSTTLSWLGLYSVAEEDVDFFYVDL